ncbi:MAG: Mannose-6-phosphate isomerase, type II [Candidatus Wolfebacteria bacterium GW2011_GWA1_47_6]|nr:MAG: Mannose-6-phosphate isomerase, type II [Candidatus Wolfebacteria bacterium GW2011_GWA1_47_6]
MNIQDEQRPWGSFRRFTLTEPSTVKLVSINAGKQLSLQYHNDREEFWRILDGNPTIIIGDSEVIASVGDEFFVPKKTNHRIRANDQNVRILELAFGSFDEADIVRLEDSYGRASA